MLYIVYAGDKECLDLTKMFALKKIEKKVYYIQAYEVYLFLE